MVIGLLRGAALFIVPFIGAVCLDVMMPLSEYQGIMGPDREVLTCMQFLVSVQGSETCTGNFLDLPYSVTITSWWKIFHLPQNHFFPKSLHNI